MTEPAIVRRLEADVRCYHCGRSVGTLLCAINRPHGAMLFRRARDDAWSVIRTPGRLRCSVCDGPTFVEYFETFTRVERRVLDRELAPRPA
jgi:hypothetical protein